MQATLEGNVLVVRIPLGAPRPSSTGKTMVLATGQSKVAAGDKVLTVGVNVYTKQPK
jgi:hypothetical protein